MGRISQYALLLGLLGISPHTPAALDETTCRLELDGLPAAFAQCATLSVAIDASDADGPSLDLFVARMPALSANPQPDPLVLITGGPGQSTVDFYLQMRRAFELIRRERDIVLLDQRGTGRSINGLSCDLPDDLEFETSESEVLSAAVERCLANFDPDPRLFTTSAAVEDLDRLRQALGVDQWNLYGVSYGTRVAQHYLRRFPDSSRAVILDGVVPAELALGPDIAPNAQSALDAIFERCSTNSVCAARFMNLADKFATVQQRLAAEPVEYRNSDPLTGVPKDFLLSDAHLQAVTRLMSYAAPTVALLPLILDDAYNGNYLSLGAQVDIILVGVAEALSFPMHNSVVCTEDVPFFAAAEPPGNNAPYLGTTIVDALRTICEQWPAGLIDANFKSPLQSDRPVLLLSGENDPVTPPAYAQLAISSGLSNSVHVVGPGQGHGLAGIGCVPTLMRDFLTAAQPADVNADCLAEEPPTPFFINALGPAP